MLRKTLLGLAAGVSSLLCANSAQAQYFYIGQVILVGFDFCPRNFAETAGQVLPLQSNTALFSLIGTTYGGNGTTNFALPDLRGRTPISLGRGPGLSGYVLGQAGGVETNTLTLSTMPTHMHTGVSRGSTGSPNTTALTNAAPSSFAAGQPVYKLGSSPDATMASGSAVLDNTGSNESYSILSPYNTLRYCITTSGIFPPRG